jgi:hypothetical protein
VVLAGCFVAWQLLGQQFLGQHGAQLAACLVASYIGGSVNFAAVAAATQLPAALLPGAVAADNLAMLVLLTILMAVPARMISSWGISSSSSSAVAAVAAVPLATGTAGWSAAPTSQSSLDAAVGRDGKPLLTAVPAAHEVAACFETSAKGRRASSSSSSSSSNGSKDKLPKGSLLQRQQQQQHSNTMKSSLTGISRKLGQLALDGAPLLTPDPGEDHHHHHQQQQQQQQPHHRQVPSTSSAAAAAAAALAATGAVVAAAAAQPAKSNSSSKANCGGCRAKGVTALDHHPLLTTAPAMADAINTIAAAREGTQTLVLANPEDSAAEDPAAGCGGCDLALDAIAAAAASSPLAALAGSSSSSSSSSGSAGQQSPATSGALGLDNAPLLTAEPDGTQLAAAVTAAKKGLRGGQVSVSDSVSSLSSSDSDEDLELLMRFSMKDLQRRLEQQQQQQLEGKAERVQPCAEQQQQQQQGGQQVAMSSGGEALTAAISSSTALHSTLTGSLTSTLTGSLTSTTAAASLAAAALSAAASHQVAGWLSAPTLQLLLLSGIAAGMSVAASAAWSAYERRQGLPGQPSAAGGASSSTRGAPVAAAGAGCGLFSGASSLGQLLMGLFFATLGTSCCCSVSSMAAAAPLVVFVALMVAVHWLLLAAVGPLLGLPGPALLAGSVANIGGPATAAAIVSGRGLGQQLVQPSLLCGSLGYAIGTAAGLLVARGLGVTPS